MLCRVIHTQRERRFAADVSSFFGSLGAFASLASSQMFNVLVWREYVLKDILEMRYKEKMLQKME
jgi:hypothetical protein